MSEWADVLARIHSHPETHGGECVCGGCGARFTIGHELTEEELAVLGCIASDEQKAGAFHLQDFARAILRRYNR